MPYLLIELFYIGISVVRPDGRSVGVPNFLGWVDYHISLAMGLRYKNISKLRKTNTVTISSKLKLD